MITREAVSSYLMALSKFSLKHGADLSARKELMAAIDRLTDDPLLYAIYVNDEDDIRVPDVAVLHVYNKGFAGWLLNADTDCLCPFGYTIEISMRCFDKFTDEELGAVILHDVLQNIMSDTTKIRFYKAYTAVMSTFNNAKVLDTFDNINLDETLYIGFLEMCLRPFKAPVSNEFNFVAVDDTLKVMGLADAYNSYLDKTMPMSNLTVEEAMEQQCDFDIRDMRVVMKSCVDQDIRHYFNVIRMANPLISIEQIMGSKHGQMALGFICRDKQVKWKTCKPEKDMLTESYNTPRSDYDIRFQIDKIRNSARYAETESERDVILYKIKSLSLKIMKIQQKLEKQADKGSSDGYYQRMMFLNECLKELEELRESVMSMEIKEKRWGIYVKGDMPEGYDM